MVSSNIVSILFSKFLLYISRNFNYIYNVYTYSLGLALKKKQLFRFLRALSTSLMHT